MKRTFIGIFLIAIIIASTACNTTVIKKVEPENNTIVDENKQAPPSSIISEDKIKGVGLLYNRDLDIDKFKDVGFNTAFITVNGVRISKPPYRTDLKLQRELNKTISSFNDKNMSYIINITSGPGYSSDGSTATIFENRQEAMYYARMCKEIIKAYTNDPSFGGLSLSFNNPDIPEGSYYSTISYIATKISEEYPNTRIILNLHPLSFENGMKNIPRVNAKNVVLNANIHLKSLTYPGNSYGYNSSFKLSRNSILSSLQVLKDNAVKDENEIMVSIAVPWSEKSDVFLQDVFEIIKMLDLNYKIEYGNSLDSYDFKNTEEVLKILKRHSN